jgi:hypothetical protein
MAKKSKGTRKNSANGKRSKGVAAAAAARAGSRGSASRSASAVRNTAIPKAPPQQQRRQVPHVANTTTAGPVRSAAPARSSARATEVTQEAIARRAYDIFLSGTGGSEFDNWCRAERELRGA